ncbi:MAG: ABC transporter permease [bacterium]
MHQIGQDIRLALRGFRRTPTFAASVLAILGISIGLAVAMFAAFQTILIRRLPVTDQDRIAVLWTYHTPSVELAPLSTAFPDVRRASRTMRGIAGVVHWGAVPATFLDGDQPIGLSRAQVTGNYFEVLGARPALGRLLRAEDDEVGAPAAMVLSYGVWQSQFGGSASVIGRRLLDPYTRNTYGVVGVAPAGLDYPIGADCWTPVPTIWTLQMLAVARLVPGASVDGAAAEFYSIISGRQPDLQLTGAHGSTLTETVLGDTRPVIMALAAAAGLLLLIACVNVGNLFLLRAASRTRELAVRRALGASYGDLLRQLVVESSLLAVAGGALGVGCAVAFLRGLVALAPVQLPRLDSLRLYAAHSGEPFGMAVGVTTVCALLFGVLPALVTARANLASPLRLDERSGAETKRHRHVRDWLVASQVALALVMLAGAGLLARTLQRLERLDLGFQAEHVSIVSFAFDVAKASSPGVVSSWTEQLERRVTALPGVTAATPILIPPFLGPSLSHPQFDAEGQTFADAAANPNIPIEVAGAEYFRTFGIPLLRGRRFYESDRENAAPVVIVSESVARKFWPGQSPIGKRVRMTPPTAHPEEAPIKGLYDWRTVVGVAPDTHFRALRDASPTVYFPWRQFGWQGYFAIRSTGDIAPTTEALRRVSREIDPTLVVSNLRSMDQMLSGPLARPRLSAILLLAFGAAALVLAAVGLYGVMASGVREQTREIGIRMALGATQAVIRHAVMRRALIVAGAGAASGLVAALLGTRLLRSLLFEISPTDPVALGAACGALLTVAAVAAYLPARRATKIDPALALRAD